MPKKLKICPFRSTPKKEIPCFENCELYSNRNKGCIIREIESSLAYVEQSVEQPKK